MTELRRETAPGSHEIILDATRALLWVDTAARGKAVVVKAVEALGGSLVAATAGDPTALPVDVSFGEGVPILAAAPRGSDARALLERHLPSLVLDARRAVELGSQAQRLAVDASIDSLTGLPNRRTLGRAMGRLQRGDTVIMLDLDNFKELNDTFGHPTGDKVLRAFARTLQGTVRARDTVGRYGGEEFVVILHDESTPDAFLTRLRRTWEHARPHALTFSAGIARVGADPAAALRGADQAMYQAKEAGRDRWGWAGSAELDGRADVAVAAPIVSPPAFVAVSRLEVPGGGQEQLEAAFRARLGAVDAWPGFRALEVWADLADATAYTMVSWWDSQDAFRDYMRSDDHRCSHQRIQDDEFRPRPRELRRFRVVAR